MASWWFPFLLLGIGTAMLHPLAASGESMRALGYASIFGAASLTAKAAASAARRSAQWIASKGTDFFYKDAPPEQESPPDQPVTEYAYGEVGPTEFREYILPWLLWPTRIGGIWQPSTPGKVKTRRANLPWYCATSSCPLSQSQTKRPSRKLSKSLIAAPPTKTPQRPLSKDDTILEARDRARVLHFAKHPISSCCRSLFASRQATPSRARHQLVPHDNDSEASTRSPCATRSAPPSRSEGF